MYVIVLRQGIYINLKDIYKGSRLMYMYIHIYIKILFSQELIEM